MPVVYSYSFLDSEIHTDNAPFLHGFLFEKGLYTIVNRICRAGEHRTAQRDRDKVNHRCFYLARKKRHKQATLAMLASVVEEKGVFLRQQFGRQVVGRCDRGAGPGAWLASGRRSRASCNAANSIWRNTQGNTLNQSYLVLAAEP